MSIFRRLILFNWLRFFFYAFFVFMLLIFVSTMVSGISRSSVSAMEVLTDFSLDLPKWLMATIPISCLCATLFFLDRLKSRNELIVIFASGFTRRDFILTIIFVTCIIAGLQFGISTTVQPILNKMRNDWLSSSGANFKSTAHDGLRKTIISSDKIWYKSQSYFLSFHSFDKKNNVIKNLDLYSIGQNQQIEGILMAKEAIYESGHLWNFRSITLFSSLNHLNFPKISTAPDKMMEISETPEDFKQIESEVNNLKFKEFYRYISKLKSSGINTDELEILFYNKIEVAIICLVFSLLPITAIYSPSKRHSSFGKNAAFTFVFALLYYFVYSTLLELGNNGQLPPLLAAFLIPGLFTFYLFYQFIKNKRLV